MKLAICVIKDSINSTGINEQLIISSTIRISLNPASDYIKINPDGWTPADIKIYNTFGECVINYEFLIMNYENLRIYISHLPIGIYFLQIGKYSEKFIKI